MMLKSSSLLSDLMTFAETGGYKQARAQGNCSDQSGLCALHIVPRN
jgi:hypothetical protein